MRALILAASLLACAAPRTEPPVVAVAAVDGGAPLVTSAEPAPVNATPEMLETAITETVHLSDAILARCVGRLADDDLARVRQSMAAGYADRDELVMRRRRNSFADRDVQKWWESERKSARQLREIATRACPAALRESP